MLKPLPKLQESEELVNEVPAPAISLIAVFRRQLLRVRTQAELEDVVALLKGICRGAPAMVAVFPDNGIPAIDGKISLGWSDDWEARYRARAYYEVDPVAHALPGALTAWSPLLAGKRSQSERVREFLSACIQYGMTHGLSYISGYSDCRVIISLVGKEIEEDRLLRHALAAILPDIADVAYRVFARFREISDLEKIDQDLISLICKHGLTNKEAAKRMQLTDRAVNYHLKHLRILYGAKTNQQLMFKIGSGDPRSTHGGTSKNS
ncbi:hypothetical protein BUE93_20900 [Chromobacterium amazonense]|uniref:Transcription factor LuxR-like autoinducer-binding domain-containing protein n=1 Tax=Chromobacterium amazonense TaxID=1382803 RepID=A0A2S9WZ28_9NEIS|nr:autoinducer binding domain-containing protein [Chromobacterium amazonense]PRP68725.1 hypothetical protein BUE93_20900 [Chromobacterium amazonense]